MSVYVLSPGSYACSNGANHLPRVVSTPYLRERVEPVSGGLPLPIDHLVDDLVAFRAAGQSLARINASAARLAHASTASTCSMEVRGSTLCAAMTPSTT